MEDNLHVLPEEEAREEKEASTNNPMLIDSVNPIKQCRSVSKQWHKDSTPTWLAKGPPLKLSLDPNSSCCVGSTMREFLGLVHNNDSHSCGPYELSGLRQYKKFEVVGDATNQDEHDYLLSFLRICGHDLTELYIPDFDTYLALMLSPMSPNLVKLSADLRFSKGGVLKKGTFELLGEEHRTLTSLQIYCHMCGAGDLAKLSESGWVQLLKRYPNLKSLLLTDKRVQPKPTKPRKSVGRRAPQRSQPWFDGVLETLLPLFRDGQLSLETLEICLGHNTSAETIVELLASQAATLKKLSLQRAWRLEHFQPPKLPFVESLELLGRPFQDLTSLSRFPALKSISFAYYQFRGYIRFSDHLAEMLEDTRHGKGFILPTVSKLHCDYKSGGALLTCASLARLFPNLKDLLLWLDNDALEYVALKWPGLQHLTIIGDGVTDGGIAMVTPYLPKMRDLKSLVMRQLNGPTALTEKSLVAFLKLPNLERLEISLADNVSVGPALLRKLEGRIKRVKITWI